jgi:lysine-specific permease
MLALTATTLISALAFFSNMVGDQKIYQLFYNASSLSGFLIWFGIAVCHLRFRKAWLAQGRRVEDLKFRAKFYPWGQWLALGMFVFVIFGANIGVFQAPVFSWFDFVTGYLMIPVYLALYFGHKLRNKTHLVPIQQCNFDPSDP